ncbi:MAG: tetratricopeptide repeat protein, partial [Saprospiraceae bacterium]
TKKDEGLGIISFDNAKLNYNQVINQVLTIVDHLEEGKTSLNPVAPTLAKNRTWLYVAAGVLAIVVVGFIALRSINESKPDVVQNLENCPTFKNESPFNVLLFRYLTVGGTPNSLQTHKLIQSRLGELRDQHQLNMDIGVFNDMGNNELLPVDVQTASNFAENCRAKLVIFGTEEPKPDRAIITTRYKFLNIGEQFQFVKLRINERTQVDTVTSISSIGTSGEVTGDIEQQLLQLLLGVVAYEANQIDRAIGLLQTAEPVDSGTFMLRNMVLADAYIKSGQTQAALSTYDQVLTEHPQYNFALENRAALLYERGDYLAAIQDYNTRLENSPGDIGTLTQRGVAHLKAENLEEARQDLEKVQKENPEDSVVRQQLKIVRQRLEEKQEMKEDANQKLRENPRDTKALIRKADAAKSLGDYEESIKTAEQLIRQDPKNVQAYTT